MIDRGRYVEINSGGGSASQTSGGSSVPTSDIDLTTWSIGLIFILLSAERDDDSGIKTANIQWPDGSKGTFKSDAMSENFPGAIDAWTATYIGVSKANIRQPLMTRDSNGAVIAQPPLIITYS